MRDLYLVRKPATQMSERFRWWSETENRHNSRWNFHADGKWDHGHYIVADKGHGIFGHTSHIMGDAARIAAIYWDRYLDTQDRAWLRDRAYPMIRGAAEVSTPPFPDLEARTASITLLMSTTANRIGTRRIRVRKSRT